MTNEKKTNGLRIKNPKYIFFLIALSFFIGYLIKNRDDYGFLLSMKTVYLIPLVLMIGFGLVLSGYRLHVVLSFFSPSIRFKKTFKYFILGGFINKFFPHGGGAYRLMMFKKECNISYRNGLSTLVAFGLINTMTSLTTGIFIVGLFDPHARILDFPILLIFAIILGIQLTAIPLLKWVLDRYLPSENTNLLLQGTKQSFLFKVFEHFLLIMQKCGDILKQTLVVMKNGKVLIKSVLIIIFNFVISIFVFQLLFLSINQHASLAMATLLAVTMRLTSVVELTPGNLVLREFLMGFLTGGMGMEMAYGITASMIWRLALFFINGLLSLYVILRNDGEIQDTISNASDGLNRSDSHGFSGSDERDGSGSESQKKSFSTFIERNNSPSSIFLLGPSSPFRGGIAHYNTLLFNHLGKSHDVTFYTFKKQYFRFLFPGNTDKDNSIEKIEPEELTESGDRRVHRCLHPLNLLSWFKAGKEAMKHELVLLPWWVVFWTPYYLIFLYAFKSNGGNGLNGGNGRNSKLIFLCHNVVEHEQKFSAGFKRWLSRMVLRKGDGFILHSRGQEEQLRNLLQINSRPVIISPHPIYEIFNKNRYDRVSARLELGIPIDRKVLLFFGFIREYKGLAYLLKAMPLLKAAGEPILLLIVGEVWHASRNTSVYIQMIQELGLTQDIRFIDRYVPNEEVEVYFKGCDMVVLPYTEGSGSGILQIAYGMNRPVVASRISAFQDVVVENKTGILVPPADERALADGITGMFRNGYLSQMEEEIQEYKKKFDWPGMVDSIKQLMTQLN